MNLGSNGVRKGGWLVVGRIWNICLSVDIARWWASMIFPCCISSNNGHVYCISPYIVCRQLMSYSNRWDNGGGNRIIFYMKDFVECRQRISISWNILGS